MISFMPSVSHSSLGLTFASCTAKTNLAMLLNKSFAGKLPCYSPLNLSQAIYPAKCRKGKVCERFLKQYLQMSLFTSRRHCLQKIIAALCKFFIGTRMCVPTPVTALNCALASESLHYRLFRGSSLVRFWS